MKKVINMTIGFLLAGVVPTAYALDLCVFDVVGAQGDTANIIKDYVLVAKQWQVDIQPKIYTHLGKAMKDFEENRCDGIVADNFTTKKYNNFMSTVGAVGAIPNYQVSQQVFQALASPRLAHKFNQSTYEVVGYIPYGFAYLFTKDRSLNSIHDIEGKRIGVMQSDPAQRRMAQKLGLVPVAMNIDNVAQKFKNDEFDLLPIPLIAYQAFDGKTILGEKGGVVNYPLSMVSMNVIFKKGKYPVDLGQKSRNWFSQQSGKMIQNAQNWQSHLPPHIFYELSKIDYPTYDRLISQLRKEFIENKSYDATMITLIRHLRCQQDPKYIECNNR